MSNMELKDDGTLNIKSMKNGVFKADLRRTYWRDKYFKCAITGELRKVTKRKKQQGVKNG